MNPHNKIFLSTTSTHLHITSTLYFCNLHSLIWRYIQQQQITGYQQKDVLYCVAQTFDLTTELKVRTFKTCCTKLTCQRWFFFTFSSHPFPFLPDTHTPTRFHSTPARRLLYTTMPRTVRTSLSTSRTRRCSVHGRQKNPILRGSSMHHALSQTYVLLYLYTRVRGCTRVRFFEKNLKKHLGNYMLTGLSLSHFSFTTLFSLLPQRFWQEITGSLRRDHHWTVTSGPSFLLDPQPFRA